ncbi:MAG: MFS transporter [Candidatus Sigynarchaeota archaeon]
METSARRQSYLPLYLAEACQTGGRSVYAIALVNYLLFERGFGTGETGAISAFYNLGFLAFTFLAGRAIDRFGRERLLEIVTLVIFACSVYYLVPIERGPPLVLFVVVRTIDGGATGIFWSAVQSYAKKLADIDQASRNAFTSKYNFSWNAGVIVGTVAGWILTAGTRTNVFGFCLSVIVAGIQFVSIFAMRRTRKMPENGQMQSDLANPLAQRALTSEERATMTSIPMILLFLSLLTHSFTTGGLSIYLPAKVLAFSLPSFVSYMFFFEQSIAQTASMTIGGKIKERQVSPAIVAGPAIIGLGWLLLGASIEGIAMSFAIILQSTMQGILYSSGMRFLTNVAQAREQPGLFARFQFVMGFGRMSGPFIFGFLIELGLGLAVGVTVIFDLVVFTLLLAAVCASRRNRVLSVPTRS